MREEGNVLGFGKLDELVVLEDALEEIALLVVVRSQDDKEDDVAQNGGPESVVGLDRRGVVHLAVVLADLEVLGRLKAPKDHEGVIPELEILSCFEISSTAREQRANAPRAPSPQAI